MQKLFTLDGSYFFHRCLGSLNMGDQVNNLINVKEQNEFTGLLTTSLLNLWNAVAPYFDNMIFVTDNDSWRKHIEPVKPYFITEEDAVISYKGQRKDKKETSTIDYNIFYSLCQQFIDGFLKPNMLVFDVKGFEGDDNILMISNKVKELDIFNTVFCTDGDLMQTVNNNNILFRNIKSKVAPFGEFVINMQTYESVFEMSAKMQLLSNALNGPTYYKNLFGITTKGITTKRSLNQGINITNPFKLALIKSICGDKKDNIFPIFRWVKGSKNYSVTEKMVEKALKLDTQYLTESVAAKYLTNKDLLTNLLTNLRDITGQKHIELTEIATHLKHNLKLIILTKNNLPEKQISEFNRQWEANEQQIIHGKFDSSFLQKRDVTIKDNATDIMQNSIPELNMEV